ncbi:MAG: PHP domain-containing protein, partial [Edaphobacter sp.]
HMGDLLAAPSGTTVDLIIHAAASEGSQIQFLLDGKQIESLPSQTITTADQTVQATWPSDGKHHWLETDVVTPEGQLQLLGNPIYLNW